jgi:diguanylate cyclase (GGDEF)-like protein
MLIGMSWLESVSNSIALIVCIAVIAAVFASSRREPASKLAWQKRAVPLVMLAAAGIWAAAGYIADGPAQIAIILTAQLQFILATILAWPLLKDFASYSAQVSFQQAQCRRDVARAAAAESRHWLLLAEKIARVGHWRYAVADGCLSWSDEMFTILGIEPGGPTPALDSFFAMIAPDDRARSEADFAKAVATASPFEFTVETLREGRPPAYVTARGIPEFDDAGQVTALFGVLEDVTAQKRIEAELYAARQANAVANEALETLIRHDALTQLANRRHFDEAITQEFKRAARDLHPVGLIMIDLDHFKAFNDEYGQPASDTCLQTVSAAIANIPQRPADLVARYDGVEIAVLLPNTDLIGTGIMADLIVQAVRELGIPHAGNPEFIVTISCGTAAFEPARDPYLALNLVEKADQTLNAAKRDVRQRAMAA